MSAATEEKVDKVALLHDKITAGVQALIDSDDWTAWLRMATRFHTYSPNNQLLIWVQRPDATQVAGFNAWKALGRQVRKGEKGIAILAPVRYSPRKDKPEDLDDKKRDGRARGFRGAYVFDISQTDGDPLPDVGPTLLQGEGPDGVRAAVTRLIEGHGYAVEEADLGATNGVTRPDMLQVLVHRDRSPLQQIKTLLHELAHIECGHVEDTPAEYRQHQGRVEVEAESTAFIVAGALGLDVGAYSFGYVAGWSKGDVTVVKATADAASKAARTILDALEVSA